jgi:hypothetical protein
MNLEITPEPTDAERAAIVAALAQETATKQQCSGVAVDDDCEESVKP